MLIKLITNDFRFYKAKIKWVLPIYLMLVLSGMVFLMLRVPILGELLHKLAIIATVGLLPASLLLGLIHYYRSLYTNQGYLTHTLPVKPSLHVYGKWISAFLLYVLASLTAILGGLLLFWADTVSKGGPTNVLEQVGSFICSVTHIPGVHPMTVQIIMLIVWVSVSLSAIVVYSFSITFGMSRRLARFGIGGPILVYLLVYFVQQVLMLVANFIVPLSMRLTVEGKSVVWDIVPEFPTSLVDLIKLGDNVTLEQLSQQFSGGFKMGLGIFMIIPLFMILAAVLTQIEFKKVDLR